MKNTARLPPEPGREPGLVFFVVKNTVFVITYLIAEGAEPYFVAACLEGAKHLIVRKPFLHRKVLEIDAIETAHAGIGAEPNEALVVLVSGVHHIAWQSVSSGKLPVRILLGIGMQCYR